MALAFALIAVSIGTVVAWLHFGGRISGSVLVPGIIGAVLLARPRLGSLEYARDTRELVIVRRTLVTHRTLRVPADDITGVTVEAASWKEKNPQYELRLMLKHDKHVLLSRGNTPESLESARVRAADFLLSHGLVHEDRVRVDALQAARNSLNPEPETDVPSSVPSHVKPTKPP